MNGNYGMGKRFSPHVYGNASSSGLSTDNLEITAVLRNASEPPSSEPGEFSGMVQDEGNSEYHHHEYHNYISSDESMFNPVFQREVIRSPNIDSYENDHYSKLGRDSISNSANGDDYAADYHPSNIVIRKNISGDKLNSMHHNFSNNSKRRRVDSPPLIRKFIVNDHQTQEQQRDTYNTYHDEPQAVNTNEQHYFEKNNGDGNYHGHFSFDSYDSNDVQDSFINSQHNHFDTSQYEQEIPSSYQNSAKKEFIPMIIPKEEPYSDDELRDPNYDVPNVYQDNVRPNDDPDSDSNVQAKIDIPSVLKSAVTHALNSPDVKSALANIPKGKDRDSLLQKLIEDQLTSAVSKDPNIMNQLSLGHSQMSDKNESVLSQESESIACNSPKFIEPHDPPRYEEFKPVNTPVKSPMLSPLQLYIQKQFKNKSITYKYNYCCKDNVPDMLIIDYKAKFLMRQHQQADYRILPQPKEAKDIETENCCKTCLQKINCEAFEHEKSYIHLIVSGEWWNLHPHPPKFLPVAYQTKFLKQKTYVWCVICFEKYGFETNEQLYQHLRSSNHQFNKCCWKECYNTLPTFEWCLWEDVKSMQGNIPKATVNGFDWGREMETSFN